MKLLIVGAGGHGRCCLDIARDMHKYDEISFLDDEHINETINDCSVIGSIDEMSSYYPEYTHIHIAIGNNKIRKQLLLQAQEIGYSLDILKHSTSIISSYASLEQGCVIFPYAVVEANASLAKGCIIASHVVINHDAILDEYVLVNTGTIIRPNTKIHSLVSIGSNCLVRMNKEIDKESIIEDGIQV